MCQVTGRKALLSHCPIGRQSSRKNLTQGGPVFVLRSCLCRGGKCMLFLLSFFFC